MTQINLSTNRKEKKKHIHREQTCGCQGGGKTEEGWIRNLGLADVKYHTIIHVLSRSVMSDYL